METECNPLNPVPQTSADVSGNSISHVLCGGAETLRKRKKICLRQSSDRAKAQGLMAFKTFKELNLQQLEQHQHCQLGHLGGPDSLGRKLRSK